MLGRYFRKKDNSLKRPVFFRPSAEEKESGAHIPEDLLRRKEALRKKFRQAFVAAISLPIAAFSAHKLIENKDAETNLEKPGLVLTIKEIFDQKSIERLGPQIASQQRLDRIFGKMSQTEMGRDILQYIKTHKVKVSFYDITDKDDEINLKEGKLGTYHPDKNLIKLNAKSPDDAIMVTLAHEARHAWQAHKIKYWMIEGTAVSPEKKLLIRRYVEADAFAYQTAFALDFESDSGKRLVLGRNAEVDKTYKSTDAEMREALRQELINGTDQKQARLAILRLAFETLQDRGYDKKSIEGLDQNINALYKNSISRDADAMDEKSITALRSQIEKIRREPDWETVIKYLRKFGNMGLHDNDANYLDNVSDKDMTSLDWMGGLSDIRAPQFKKIKSMYASILEQSQNLFLDEPAQAESAAEEPVQAPAPLPTGPSNTPH